MIPDICDKVSYDNRNWRVCGWFKKVTIHIKDPLVAKVLGRKSVDKLAFCTQEEAEFIEIYAICGAIVRVGDVEILGKINWTEEAVAREKESFLCRIGETLDLPERFKN